MTKPKTIIGWKMLRNDGSSIREEGRVTYSKKWQDVGGNGAYLAISGGLTNGGEGAICAEIEAVSRSEIKGIGAPDGVRCFGRVRVRRWLTVPTAPALAEYQKAKATAWAEYEKATATAWAEYQKATATACAEYEKATTPACAEYEKATAPALAEYQKAKATAFRAMMKTCKEISVSK